MQQGQNQAKQARFAVSGFAFKVPKVHLISEHFWVLIKETLREMGRDAKSREKYSMQFIFCVKKFLGKGEGNILLPC